jgi:hypothetical protein
MRSHVDPKKLSNCILDISRTLDIKISKIISNISLNKWYIQDVGSASILFDGYGKRLKIVDIEDKKELQKMIIKGK